MKGDRMKRFIFVFIFAFLFVFTSVLSTQDVFIQAKFPLKKVKAQGFDIYQGILAWTPVSEDVNIGFARNHSSGTDEYSLVSLTFSDKGKCQSPILAAVDKGYPYVADLVWFNGESQTQELQNAYGGLVFALFSNALYQPGEEVTLAVAQFEENGILTSSWTDLITVKAPSPLDFVYDKTLGVSIGDDCVGLSLSVVFYNNISIFRSFSYFLRTDFQGNLVDKPVRLKLFSNGARQSVKVFRPAWNGARWLVPLANTHINDPYFYMQSSQVYVYASKDEKARKFKSRRIAQDKEDHETYDCLNLIPINPASLQADPSIQAKGNDYLLFVQHMGDYSTGPGPANLIPDYHLYTINAHGRASGKPVEVLIPNQGFSNSRHNYVSNIIPSHLLFQGAEGEQSEEDFLSAAQIVTISPGPALQRLNFYKIYPSDGSVATLAKKEIHWRSKQIMPPSMRWNGKSILVLNQGEKYTQDRTASDFISSFKIMF